MRGIAGLGIAFALASAAACGGSDDGITQPGNPDPGPVEFGEPDFIVQPGASIQAAVDSAPPNSVIQLEPGVYAQTVTVGKPGIRIVGRGTAIIQNPGGERFGIIVTSAGQDFGLGNVTVRGFTEQGVRLVGVDGFVLSRVTAEDNGLYGLFPIRSTNGVMEYSLARGHFDAGIYIGQSDAITIRRNTAHDNVVGIEVENSTNVRTIDNDIYDNVLGVLVVLLPGLAVRQSSDNVVARNRIRTNNLAGLAGPGSYGERVPLGTGILIAGADRTVVERNAVTGNHLIGIGLVSTVTLRALIGVPPTAFQDIDPLPHANRIRRNTLADNGLSGSLPLFPAADLSWDGDGSENCWADNTFVSSAPDPLPGCET